MTRHRYAVVAMGVGIAAVIVAGLVLNAINLGANAGLEAPVKHDVVFSLWAAAYSVAGLVIVARSTRNAVGWLLVGAGLILGLGSLGFEYANLALGPRGGPGGAIALWISETPSVISLALISLALLLFPDGHPPSRRWRAVIWMGVGGVACLLIGIGLLPGRMDPASSVQNPLGIEGFGTPLTIVAAVGWLMVAVAFLGAGAATVVRLRRSHGAARQQMKWVVYAAVILGVVWAQWTITYLTLFQYRPVVYFELAIVTAAMCGIPVAMGIAIVRYRLYGIDVIIRKTLVYGLLVAMLAGLYIAAVLVFSQVLGRVAGSGALTVTLSTLAVAAAFQPVRARIQRLVDQRFYREHYDAVRVVENFNLGVRNQVDPDSLRAELLAVVAAALQPSSVGLWVHADNLQAESPRRDHSEPQTR